MPKAFLIYPTLLAKIAIPIVVAVGLVIAATGMVDLARGDELGWQSVQIGLGLSALVIVAGWAWIRLFRAIGRWMEKSRLNR